MCPLLQRRRDTAGRWDESRTAEDLPLPPLAIKWQRWPFRQPDLTKVFSPRPENLPVGTRLPQRERFVATWADICLPILETIASFTNERGKDVDAANWRDVDFVTFAKFECALLRMGHIRRNRMKDYFSVSKGDPVIQSLNLSFKTFAAIYRNIRMFSSRQAHLSGASNSSSSATYDGLYGIRPGWNAFMTSFQRCRTPPEVSATDGKQDEGNSGDVGGGEVAQAAMESAEYMRYDEFYRLADTVKAAPVATPPKSTNWLAKDFVSPSVSFLQPREVKDVYAEDSPKFSSQVDESCFKVDADNFNVVHPKYPKAKPKK